MGSRRGSSITGAEVFISECWATLIDRPGVFNFAAPRIRLSWRESYGGAPEQQKQKTNITVHREKRSIQPPQIVGMHERMLVREECCDHDDAGPRRPWQLKASR